jgi:hypothetical protein
MCSLISLRRPNSTSSAASLSHSSKLLQADTQRPEVALGPQTRATTTRGPLGMTTGTESCIEESLAFGHDMYLYSAS